MADSEDSIVSSILKYLSGVGGLLVKGSNTAGGKTDDKTPDEPAQTKAMASMSTDARKIANAAFSMATLRTPAELLATGDAYDVTQACTRIAKVYAFTRSDYYAQAKRDLETRRKRLALKQLVTQKTMEAVDRVNPLLGVKDQ